MKINLFTKILWAFLILIILGFTIFHRDNGVSAIIIASVCWVVNSIIKEGLTAATIFFNENNEDKD